MANEKIYSVRLSALTKKALKDKVRELRKDKAYKIVGKSKRLIQGGHYAIYVKIIKRT